MTDESTSKEREVNPTSWEQSDDFHRTSFRDFVAQCQPLVWGDRNTMLLDRWFEWPPDIFGLSSLVLRVTGAYRKGATPPKEHQWPPFDWGQKASNLAKEWRNWVAEGCRGEHPLKKTYLEPLLKLQHVAIDDLYDSEGEDEWRLCRILLELLGISDEAMRGVGIAFSPLASLHQVLPEQNHKLSRETSFFYMQANMLLALRGSLSRMPKFRGTVLPKSRTPQVGLTLRSFSNNLTFHQTQVDVAWRAFPWLNTDENVVNIMMVAWPFEVEAGFFSSVHPNASSYVGQARYFHYMPRDIESLEVQVLLDYLHAAKREVHRIHMMVFPELALSRSGLRLLKTELEAQFLPSEIPMIVSGVGSRFKNEEDEKKETHPDSQADRWQHALQAKGANRIVLSIYYAGRWHDVIQDKHHRWRLDDNQIAQYGLGGILSGGRYWWEATQIVRRRLSVLAANSWLTISPLICEDLARLDPVSELIRGIGPSLLTAILLDGPQLRERWSARYASVFADDPGSSVLTLTSIGMSTRAIPRHPNDASTRSRYEEASRTIALWKDQEKGWFPVTISENGLPIKILALSAIMRSEGTFDGRQDQESTASFSCQGLVKHPMDRQFSEYLENLDENSEEKQSKKRYIGTPDFFDGALYEGEESKARDGTRKRLKTLDMCELTLFTYYVDAIVDHTSNPEKVHEWFKLALGLRLEPPGVRSVDRLSDEIADFMVHSIRKRDLVPMELPTPHLFLAVELVTGLVQDVREEIGESLDGQSAKDVILYWSCLASGAIAKIEEMTSRMREKVGLRTNEGSLEKETKEKARELSTWSKDVAYELAKKPVEIRAHHVGRIMLTVPGAVLWALHSRLSSRRRFGTLTSEEISLLKRIEESASGKSYHGAYLDWRCSMKKKYPG